MRRDIAKILLVRQDKIGDLVLITPAVKALKRAMPESELWVLASPYASPVLNHNPHIEGVIHWNAREPRRTTERLKDERFDAAVLFFPTWRVSWAVFRAGIPLRVGGGVRPYGFLFTHGVHIHRSRHEKSEWEYNLEVLSPLGVEAKSSEPELFLLEEEERWATALLKSTPASGKIVGLYGGGGGEIRWPLARFLELGTVLKKNGLRPIFLWGKGEEDLAREAEAAGLAVAPPTTIRELAALLHACDAVVTNNTGPMHMAAALKVPLVQIFDPRLACSPKRWGYHGKGRRVILPPVPPCKRCQPSCTYYDCMERIEPLQVFQAIQDVISEAHEKG